MLPNVVRGVHYRLLMQPRTSAGANINTVSLPASFTLPHILIRHDGGTGDPSDNRADIARITFECRAKEWEAALALALDVRDRWRPPEEVVDGWWGDVFVPAIPNRGIPAQTIHFNGAGLNAGPFFIPDEVTNTPRFNISFLISYS